MIKDDRYRYVLSQPADSFEVTDLDVDTILADVAELAKDEKAFDDHLSFTALKTFHEKGDVQKTHVEHVDACGTCQSLVDAFNPPTQLLAAVLNESKDDSKTGVGQRLMRTVIPEDAAPTAAMAGLYAPHRLVALERGVVSYAERMVSEEHPRKTLSGDHVNITIEFNEKTA